MKRIIEILIVSMVLFMLAFLVGCKDEAEAEDMTTEITIEAIDPNENIDWGNSVFLEITLLDEPNFADSDRIYLYEGDDFDIVIEKNEPNEPNEPNEEILICPDHYKRYCKICESVYYKAGWIIPFKGSYLYNQALKEKPEPNEPLKMTFGGDNMTWSIPTWPEYIELDKDLWVVDETEYGILMRFVKGTKIYFKDE